MKLNTVPDISTERVVLKDAGDTQPRNAEKTKKEVHVSLCHRCQEDFAVAEKLGQAGVKQCILCKQAPSSSQTIVVCSHSARSRIVHRDSILWILQIE